MVILCSKMWKKLWRTEFTRLNFRESLKIHLYAHGPIASTLPGAHRCHTIGSNHVWCPARSPSLRSVHWGWTGALMLERSHPSRCCSSSASVTFTVPQKLSLCLCSLWPLAARGSYDVWLPIFKSNDQIKIISFPLIMNVTWFFFFYKKQRDGDHISVYVPVDKQIYSCRKREH